MRPSPSRRRNLVVVAVTVLTLIGSLLAGSSASAATYAPVDGHSAYSPLPSGKVCANDKIQPVAPANIGGYGTVVLWYSPNCRSVWAQIYSNYTHTVGAGGNRWAADAVIHRNYDRLGRPDGKEYRCSIAVGAKSCRTLMLWDADMTSYAEGTIAPGNAPAVTARTASY